MLRFPIVLVLLGFGCAQPVELKKSKMTSGSARTNGQAGTDGTVPGKISAGGSGAAGDSAGTGTKPGAASSTGTGGAPASASKPPPKPGATSGPKDACSDDPCRHGTCKVDAAGFRCDCGGTGFAGTLCDECGTRGVICDAAAICAAREGDFACACPSTHIGTGSGTGSCTPKAARVVAWRDATCAVLVTGKVACFGNVPAPPADLNDVAEVSISSDRACARLTSGGVTCWGSNFGGALGDGTVEDHPEGVAVFGLSQVTQLQAGYTSTCALSRDGSVSCWGNNDHGELGDGSTMSRSTPTQVVGVSGATQIALGATQAYAILGDGSARGWGYNEGGRLGVGSTVDPQPTAMALAGVRDIAQIAVGDLHACARGGDGSLSCWGYNYDEQFGRAEPASSSTPVRVFEAGKVKLVAAGLEHVCALMTDGKLHCFGGNSHGQLGGGMWNEKTNVVDGLGQVEELALGTEHSCARLSDGSVRCWGSNASGQLGDASKEDHFIPVQLPLQ